MSSELRVREVYTSDFKRVAAMETSVIVEEVLSGSLPVCDLGDLGNEKVFINEIVTKNRYEKLRDEANDKHRKTFVVEDAEGKVLGKGCLRFDLENKRAVVYSFNVLKGSRGSFAGLMLLKACFDQISNYESFNNIKFDYVRAGRYERSETRKPFFSKLAEMVNATSTNTVVIDKYQWNGENVLAFNFPVDVGRDLLEEIGGFYSRHFVN